MLTWTKYPVLKREDAVVYQTAKSLGLAVDVKPICREGLEWIRQVQCTFDVQNKQMDLFCKIFNNIELMVTLKEKDTLTNV